MDNYTNKVYARPDETGAVVKFFSSVFEQPQEGDILIEEGRDDHHAHVHLKYTLMDLQGHYNYRIVDGKLEEVSTQS